MKRLFSVLLVLLLLFTAAFTASAQGGEVLPYRFADREDGIAQVKENSRYYDGFTQNDLNYRLQKKGGEVSECLSFACEQVLDFSEDEQAAIDRSMGRIRSILEEKGYTLPTLDEIVFIKTTMEEECGASAYTHGSQIYLGSSILEFGLSDDEETQRYFDSVMVHEIFHCLTRANPQFREDMYKIIGFTIAEEEFEMGPAVRELFISNPDVERHDSYAEFTINGQKMNCFLVFVTTKPFEEAGDYFFDHSVTGLVPIDDPNTLYTMEDASDFWDVFGQNTDYVIDPEECLAENFSFTLIYGNTDRQGNALKSLHIQEAMDAYLKA